MEPKDWKVVINLVDPEFRGKKGKDCGCTCPTCKCGKKEKGFNMPAPELQLITYAEAEEESRRLYGTVESIDREIRKLQRSKKWPGAKKVH